jgi:glycine/D-amino acid oxidase-like deaminating enzyme
MAPGEDIERIDNLIVGGGVSGLACARQLHDSGVPFVLVTDQLGGRLLASGRGHPLGAVMVHEDYVHMLQHTRRSSRPRVLRSYIWNGTKGVHTLLQVDWLRAFRFGKVLARFRESLNRLRGRTPLTCQKELMEADPWLRELVSQSARDFIREHGIERLAERLLGPLAGAVFLCDWEELNAFHFCVGAYFTSGRPRRADWSDTVASLTRGYSDRIVIDRVESIEETDGGGAYRVAARERQYVAKRLVLSTPVAASLELISVPDDAQQIRCHVFHILGKRRSLYRPKCSLLMGPRDEIKIFDAQPDGIDVVYSAHAEPDFARYYEDHSVLEHHFWQPAIQLSRAEWRPLRPRPNLFTIGDYNICGLEDSYVTGLFAANKIIAA